MIDELDLEAFLADIPDSKSSYNVQSLSMEDLLNLQEDLDTYSLLDSMWSRLILNAVS